MWSLIMLSNGLWDQFEKGPPTPLKKYRVDSDSVIIQIM